MFKAKQPGSMTGPLTSMLFSGKENSSYYCLKWNIPLHNEQYIRFTEFSWITSSETKRQIYLWRTSQVNLRAHIGNMNYCLILSADQRETKDKGQKRFYKWEQCNWFTPAYSHGVWLEKKINMIFGLSFHFPVSVPGLKIHCWREAASHSWWRRYLLGRKFSWNIYFIFDAWEHNKT